MTQDTTLGEAHEPTPEEHAAVDRVRRRATGMTHHQASEALEALEETAGDDPSAADAGTRAEVAEWQRITDLLYDHGGPYTPDSDAYVQGQLTARENRSTTP
ncbi:hypothetical protein [Streptomyces sp. NPDC031705]|uniref:hypothetical protein n=1 Tax=Streptomyces sp. NPDC031705 TaxID=3155729 RepID=UPI003411C49A